MEDFCTDLVVHLLYGNLICFVASTAYTLSRVLIFSKYINRLALPTCNLQRKACLSTVGVFLLNTPAC